MATGKVKWYDASKQFGFIVPVDGSQEVFVHNNQLAGCSKLTAGQEVEYMPRRIKKQLAALWARPVGLGAMTPADVQDLTSPREGWIKSFSTITGFGFIVDKLSGKDVFFHARGTVVRSTFGFPMGDRVSFTCRQGRRGIEAIDVTRV